MKEKIVSKLKEIEDKENVKILLAVESGSRAWGFASKDSDYDVRFIYVRRLEDYLKINNVRDVIEWQLDDVYDINGWDLKKALTLLHSSNPTLFEWAHSPIVYKKEEEWQYVEDILINYFNPRKCLYHYLNTAKKTYSNMKEQVKLKRYFYVLRSLFCCRYIINNQTIPPVLFKKLDFDGLDNIINELLKQKMQSEETQLINRIPLLDNYIEHKIEEYENTTIHSSKMDYDLLNKTFIKIVKKL